MTVSIFELVDSRKLKISLTDPTADFSYCIFQTTDENAARAAVEATIGPYYESADGGILPYDSYDIEHQGNGVWFATAHYSLKQKRGAGAEPNLTGSGIPGGTPPGGGSPLQNAAGTSGGRNSSFNFEIGTQSVKLTQSLQTIDTFILPGATDVPDFKGAIGVNADSVDGVDIDVPTLTFSETHYFAADFIDEAYVVALRDLAAAPVNNADFRGFQEDEVRFLGATGALRNEADWEITFRFAVSKNQTNLTIGDIVGINKKGWQYLWIGYKDAVDKNVLVKQPFFVKIEKVYNKSSFDVLGIGQ